MNLHNFSPQKLLYLNMIPYRTEDDNLIVERNFLTVTFVQSNHTWSSTNGADGTGIDSLISFYNSSLRSFEGTAL